MKDEVLSSTKARLIDLMKCEGEISVEDGADDLDLATTTIRQHLGWLEEHGFVKIRKKRHGRGRPRKIYSLTDKANVWYASRDAEVLEELLQFMVKEGAQSLLDAFFDQKQLDIFARFERDRSRDADALTDDLCDFMAQRGFVPECEFEGEELRRIEFCHCPWRSMVGVTQKPCEMEESFLEEVLGRTLIRKKHIAEGDSSCAYDVERTDN